MRALQRIGPRTAYVVLVAITAASLALGTAESTGTAILLLAFVKVRLVGLHFMGLRDAVHPLRALFETWCAVTCALTVAMYLAT
jgi:hypothetical protein